ncbi:protein tyrosine phosphatase family protein [Emcibacter nanhaiensis]|uniref:Phosphatase n=1 Tax=Emcibacter nanhaiensis TaxID=1505037 RepID=A0A501PBF7_9PROT|nr:protein tyrosine phosphatase family protein [Emcibacter nanhaiensis]TPD57377.1 phosphatase [Emcibacter nanhaiensis]
MEQLFNFHQTTDLVGTAGQPTRDQFATIAAEDYRAVINLAMPDSDNALADEASLVTSYGLSYFHIPVPFDAPTAEHLRLFFGLMDTLEGQKMLVHCVVNARVSVFMYKYLTLKKGWAADQATSPLLHGWLPEMDNVWKAVMNMSLEDIEPA